MITIECPNCKSFLTVQHNKERIVCKKCLETTGRSFIMVESKDSQKYTNIGDGFFQIEKE